MDILPPRRPKDACYRRSSITMLPVSPDVLVEPALVAHAMTMLASPTSIPGGRWPVRAVGPAREPQYDAFWLAYRARRDWVEPDW